MWVNRIEETLMAGVVNPGGSFVNLHTAPVQIAGAQAVAWALSATSGAYGDYSLQLSNLDAPTDDLLDGTHDSEWLDVRADADNTALNSLVKFAVPATMATPTATCGLAGKGGGITLMATAADAASVTAATSKVLGWRWARLRLTVNTTAGSVDTPRCTTRVFFDSRPEYHAGKSFWKNAAGAIFSQREKG
jgi:hypothetical protein